MLDGRFDYFASQAAWLAYAEAANGVAVESDFDCALGGFFAECAIHAALDDAEKGLGLSWLCSGGGPRPPRQVLVRAFRRAKAACPGVGARAYIKLVFLRADS